MFNIIKQLLDWIYRRNCYFCHKPTPTLMCEKCYEKIEINFSDPIKVINGVKIYSTSLYIDNLRKLIRGLKYHKQKELAEPLAKLLFTFWQGLDIDKDNFEIIPMPLYPLREKERRYNHMFLVAEELSKLTGYPVNNKIAIRVKNTKPQYKLSRVERIKNMKDAFQVSPKEYNGKKLLLIDDICTSGTTLGELITELKKHNIKNLYALTGANPVNDSLNQY